MGDSMALGRQDKTRVLTTALPISPNTCSLKLTKANFFKVYEFLVKSPF